MTSIMVTGATGFIGSRIAENLAGSGVQVRLPVREKTRKTRELEDRGALVFEFTGPEDTLNLGRALEGTEAVIHCAGAVRALNSNVFHRSNVLLTKTILGLTDTKALFLLISSQAAAGPSPDGVPVTETASPSPVSEYGRTKLLAEELTRAWAETPGRRHLILRPSCVYGPGEKGFEILFRGVGKGIAFLPGNGRQRISIIHVDDLVGAVMCALKKPGAGGTYFVCNDEAPSWIELAGLIQRAMSKDRVFRLRCPARAIEWAAVFCHTLARAKKMETALICRDRLSEMKPSHWLCSNEAFKTDFGWQPALTLEQGIHRTAVRYISNVCLNGNIPS